MEINEIDDFLFISGLHPFVNMNGRYLRDHNIKFILSLVPGFSHAHFMEKTCVNAVILHIPYNDSVGEDLWKLNDNYIAFSKLKMSERDMDFFAMKSKDYYMKPCIEIAFDFISQAVKSKNGVLVHCAAGISRSASVIIYYLMRAKGLTYDQAYGRLKRFRPIVQPNPGFEKQLRYWKIKKNDKLNGYKVF